MRILAAALLVSIPVLSGCTAVGEMVGETRSYTVDDTIPISGTPSNFTQRVITVGETLGYKVSSTSSARNSISFDDNEGLGSALVGIMARRTMTVGISEDGRSIGLMLMMTGNANNATQAKADGRMVEFKRALSNEFGS